MKSVFVVGQANFENIAPGISEARLTGPNGLATDGKVFIVSEYQNCRVLIYDQVPDGPLSSATVVLGQKDFKSNKSEVSALGYGGPGKILLSDRRLFVADFTNNRVLVYNQIPSTNYAKADIVIGQRDFKSQVEGIRADQLFHPVDIASNGKRLFIADYSNHRILVYDEIPKENNAKASTLIGQENFNSREPGVGPKRLKIPQGVYIYGSKLFVADSGNNRVLIYNDSNQLAFDQPDLVLGQPDFESNQQGIAANKFHEPDSIYFDGKRLFISDLKNNRVLVWKEMPAENGAPADYVIGQQDFMTGTQGRGADGFFMPRQMAVVGNILYVADRGNHRVLAFDISRLF